MDTTAQAVADLLGQVLGAKVSDDASMETCRAWDSFKHIEIIMAFEDAFGISFAPEDIPLLTSRQKLLDKVRNLHGRPA